MSNKDKYNMLTNIFSIDPSGHVIQLDDMLSRNDKAKPTPTPPEPVDPDVIGGRKYKTARVGNQVWLAENLDFRWKGLSNEPVTDGSTVPSAIYYDNDEATYGASGLNYGLLYDHAAVVYLHEHEKELIPGWRVPTKADFEELKTFVTDDAEIIVGYEKTYAGMNLCSTEGWLKQGPMAPTDKYGFNAKPSGRSRFGTHSDAIGSRCQYWSYELSQKDQRYGITFGNMLPGIMYVDDFENKTEMVYNSVRLIKDV